MFARLKDWLKTWWQPPAHLPLPPTPGTLWRSEGGIDDGVDYLESDVSFAVRQSVSERRRRAHYTRDGRPAAGMGFGDTGAHSEQLPCRLSAQSAGTRGGQLYNRFRGWRWLQSGVQAP